MEETPKKCKDIVQTAKEKYPKLYGNKNRQDELILLERILLQTIRFDLHLEHPYNFLLQYAKNFKLAKDYMSTIVTNAWTFINDSLPTNLCPWKPEVIAIALLYMSFKMARMADDDSDQAKMGTDHDCWDTTLPFSTKSQSTNQPTNKPTTQCTNNKATNSKLAADINKTATNSKMEETNNKTATNSKLEADINKTATNSKMEETSNKTETNSKMEEASNTTETNSKMEALSNKMQTATAMKVGINDNLQKIPNFSDDMALPSLDNDDETTEWDPSVNWIVEAITGRRVMNGHVEYQVQWAADGSKTWLTWPETINCRQLIREWQQNNRQQLAEWEKVDPFLAHASRQTAKRRGTHGRMKNGAEKRRRAKRAAQLPEF